MEFNLKGESACNLDFFLNVGLYCNAFSDFTIERHDIKKKKNQFTYLYFQIRFKINKSLKDLFVKE